MPWKSGITVVGKNHLSTYGIDQGQIIDSFSYEEMVYLLIFGVKPTAVQANMLRAVIVSHCSHGITGQSTLAVRMGVDCGSTFLNSALAGFLVGSGEFHQGCLSLAMQGLVEAVRCSSVREYAEQRIRERKPVHGYGHRYHSNDPRARALMKLCDDNNFVGPYVKTARELDSIMTKLVGRHMNIEAACAAILLDLGFPHEIASLLIFIGRAPMFAATFMERLRSDSKNFQRIEVSDIIPGKED